MPVTDTIQDVKVVTLADIKAGAKACTGASDARRAADAADAQKAIALMAVFEPLLGIKTEAELKALSIEEVRKLVRRRVAAGDVRVKGVTVEVLINEVIQQTLVRRNVPWKDAFIAELGESRATEVIKEAPESHSYKLVAP